MIKLSRRLSPQAGLIPLLAAALSGCGQAPAAPNTTSPLAALPLTDTPQPLTAAPPTSALPQSRPARVARLRDPRDAYAYLDRAYAQSRAYGDAPPDYTFDYRGVRPWVWRANDDTSRYAEPLPGGGYRYFYYEPGAATPYFVQDGDYGYGYSGEGLSVVYGPGGRVLAPSYVETRSATAAALLARAESIYAASRRADREAVARANWDARRSEIAAQRADWSRQQAQDDAWRAYHAAHEANEQAHWALESERRQVQTAHLAQASGLGTEAASDRASANRAIGQSPAPTAPPHPQDPLLDRRRPDFERLQPLQGHPLGREVPPGPGAGGLVGRVAKNPAGTPPPTPVVSHPAPRHDEVPAHGHDGVAHSSPSGAPDVDRETGQGRAAPIPHQDAGKPPRGRPPAADERGRALEAGGREGASAGQRVPEPRSKEPARASVAQSELRDHAPSHEPPKTEEVLATPPRRAEPMKPPQPPKVMAEAARALGAQPHPAEPASHPQTAAHPPREIAEPERAPHAQPHPAEPERRPQAPAHPPREIAEPGRAPHAQPHPADPEAHPQAAAHAAPAAAAPHRSGDRPHNAEGGDPHHEPPN